jgi:hypothetical protein
MIDDSHEGSGALSNSDHQSEGRDTGRRAGGVA